MQRTFVVSLFFFVTWIQASPTAQLRFNDAINSNDCLKQCMTPVRDSNMEMSIYKRANYSDYLLNLEKICTMIVDARRCIDACGFKSNPFALLSVNAICSTKSRQDAKVLESCMEQSGAEVHRECVKDCGDYEELNDQIHLDTSTLQPEDQSAIDSLNSRTNNACSVMKCSARCSVSKFNEKCGQLSNGILAGDALRDLIERVLATSRMDLEVFGLMAKMKEDTPANCDYLHTANTLFNAVSDPAPVQTVQQPQKRVVVSRFNPEQEAKVTATQLYVKILKKQLQVLEKQLEVLNKQEHKIETNELPRFMQNPPQQFNDAEMF
jgi:hypothetical protein